MTLDKPEIVIKENDVPETTNKCLVCITAKEADTQNDVWVTFGLPGDSNAAKEVLYPPDTPHIIHAHETVFTDPSHPEGIKLENLNVLYAHASVRDDGVWRFADGQSVDEVVCAYETWRRKNFRPHLDCVIACNIGFITWEPDVRVQQISAVTPVPVISAIDATIQASFGNNSSGVNPEGMVRFVLESKNDFMNLDEFVAQRAVSDRIEIIN